MIKLVALFFLFIQMSCSTPNHSTDVENTLLSTDTFSPLHINPHLVNTIENKDPYQIQFDIHPITDNNYSLAITINLEEGSYFVSPHSKGDYLGLFTVSLDDQQNLRINSDLVETPQSQEKIDPWGGGLVNFVTENTTYTQKITSTNSDDFEIQGLVKFVIEPKCTLEEIPFKITQRNSQLTIQPIH